MRYNRLKVLVALLAIVLLGVMQVEAGLSFIGSVQVAGGSVIASGSVAGFGNTNDGVVTVNLSVTGTNLQATCFNKGGHAAPGQNLVTVNVGTSQTGKVDSNGRYNFTDGNALHVEILPTTEEAGCPNGNWYVKYLTGTLSVVVTATDQSTTPWTTVSQSFTCSVVNDQLATCY